MQTCGLKLTLVVVQSRENYSPHMVSVKNLIYSAKFIREPQIAATMAGMLGHTAVHKVAKLEMQ
uniref:Uncharacterized protein n=1 Tax=Physcomitrium patens TaxID=3218 RepID=A0A2K1K2V9_PHYPA|nr:hypothetical protein PHYPA_012586 [Physcomitrium patens]